MGSGCREVLHKLNRHWQTGVPFLRRNLCYNKAFDVQRSKEWPAVEVCELDVLNVVVAVFLPRWPEFVRSQDV